LTKTHNSKKNIDILNIDLSFFVLLISIFNEILKLAAKLLFFDKNFSCSLEYLDVLILYHLKRVNVQKCAKNIGLSNCAIWTTSRVGQSPVLKMCDCSFKTVKTIAIWKFALFSHIFAHSHLSKSNKRQNGTFPKSDKKCNSKILKSDKKCNCHLCTIGGHRYSKM